MTAETGAGTPAQAPEGGETGSPYPPSPAISLEWVGPETRREDLDGDDWPVTWAADDHLYAAYGDGWGARPIERETKANTGLGRYLLVTCCGDFAPGEKSGTPSKLAFFDAPHPWGPWTLAGYHPRWGSGQGGDLRYDPRLPAKWLSADGLTMTLLYSDRTPSDKLNHQTVRFRSR